MQLTFVDWLAVAAYFLFNILIGLYYRKRATASTEDYFVGGRKVTWWLAGTSMVATTFAADTPLAVTGLVASYGIAGNWLWWNMLMSGMLTVFFYARLWRRAGVLTDVEFAEIRYGGKPAAFLRGFRALYLGLPINCIIMGWVNLAMVKILMMIFGITKIQALLMVFAIMLVTAMISTLSGLWGVLVTDLFQFVLKMGMMIVLACFAVQAVGGMGELKRKLLDLDAAKAAASGGHGSILSFIPDIGSVWMPMITFFVYLAVNWWATWYPGAEPGGGGYIAQRILCAKDEKHSLLATLWFNIAHYAVRPWPWILTALCSLVLYPTLADKESGFIKVIIDPQVFPSALRGLMIAAFAAAYMSTIGTQLNWGASYLVNDFYRRFPGPRTQGEALRGGLATGHGPDYADVLRSHLLSGFDCGCLEVSDCHWRGDGQCPDSSLVLVAHQCLERSVRHAGLLAGFDDSAGLFQYEQRRSSAICLDCPDHGFLLHGGLAGSHFFDLSRKGRMCCCPSTAACAPAPLSGGRLRAGRRTYPRPATRAAIFWTGFADACSCT